MKERKAVVVVLDGKVDSAVLCEASQEYNLSEAVEIAFKNECSHRLSNWDEYTYDDIHACIEQGYENFGNGTIAIVELE